MSNRDKTKEDLIKDIKKLQRKYDLLKSNHEQENKERQKTEEDFRERESNYFGLFDTVKQAIYIQNPDSTFINVNQGAVDMYGYEREYFIGKTPAFLSAEGKNDLDQVAKYVELAFNGIPQNFEFWGLKKDGTVFPKDVWTVKGTYFGKDVLITLANDISKYKQTVNDLIKTKENLKSTFDLSPSIISKANLNTGYFIEANPAISRILGYSIEEFTAIPIIEFIHPHDRQRSKDEIEVLTKKKTKRKEATFFENRYLCKDGTYKWMQWHYNKADKNGIITIIGSDIDERKKAEDSLVEKKNVLKKAESLSNQGSWKWDIIQDRWYFSDNWLRIHGVVDSGISKKELLKIAHPDDVALVNKSMLEALDNKKPYALNHRIIRKDNGLERTIQAIGEVHFDNAGKPEFMIGVAQDITEQKQIEQELINAKEEAEYLKERFDYATSIGKVGAWDWNLINDDLIWSTETYRILGHEPFSVKPSYELFLNIVHPDDREYLDSNVKAAWNEKKPYSVDCRILLNDKIRVCNASGKVEYDNNDKPVRMIGTFQDITERKNIENELIIAKEKAEESDRLKTEFINNMSHEIRTPMNGVLGFSKFLNDPNLTNDKRKNYIKIIQSSGNQLMRIVDDILEISILGTKQVKISEKEICLNDLLLKQFSIFDIKAKENKTPLYLKKGLSDIESTILTDDIKINKIVSNLLENALKFTSTGFVEFGYTLVETIHELSLQIYVKDTGIGIKPEKQEIIFERFSQEEKELTKNVGGLGLGLSIAKENTELLGGRISLQSEKGKGSTFFVSIPYKPVNEELSKDNNNEKIIVKQDKHTILIVEDEEVNFLFIETLFEDEIEINCETLHAKNGKEAVELCKENAEISFVLMDIKMPIMNGFEATKLIKEFRPNLPIVAQTAYTTDEDKEKAFSAGCDDFITKPLSDETLNKIIHKYLVMKN